MEGSVRRGRKIGHEGNWEGQQIKRIERISRHVNGELWTRQRRNPGFGEAGLRWLQDLERERMKKIRTVIRSIGIMLLLTVRTSWAFDPPVIIGEFYAPDPEAWGEAWGKGHFCFGDVNLDGKDDLFIQQRSQPDRNPYLVRLHFGSDQMSNDPDLLFSAGPEYRDRYSGYGAPGYLGGLLPNHRSLFAISGAHYNNFFEPTSVTIFVYESSENLDTIPVAQWSWNGADGPLVTGSNPIYPDLRPSDFNGDGTPDFMYCIGNLEWNELRICFGGEDFDSIPDWHYRMPYGGRPTFSVGRDINNDGYDDMLLESSSPRGDIRPEYWIFLGGAPMDTTPCFRFRETDFEGPLGELRLRGGFNLLQDVNNDGYDDWGVYWSDHPGMRQLDGYYIFFGSAEPDLEPDLTLEGRRRFETVIGYISGGDFNGDGIGDIVTGLSLGPSSTSEVMLHFGKRHIDGQADIYLYSESEYGGRYTNMPEVGAVGDYNGDGIDDFCARGVTGRDSTVLLIFAGDSDWRVDVREPDRPVQYSLSLKANPNPFNGFVSLEYSLSIAVNIRLEVFDVSGRSVGVVAEGMKAAGEYSVTWSPENSGIYLVVLSAGENGVKAQKLVRKLVCLR